MSDQRVEELLGAYALDAVDQVERDLVEQHLATCAACRAEVDELWEAASVLTGDMPPAPADVWDGIAEQIDAPQETNVVSLFRRTATVRTLTWVAGAAAALAVGLGAVLVGQTSRIGDLTTQLAAQEQQIATLVASSQIEPLQQAVTAALSNPQATVADLAAEDSADDMLVVILPDGTGYIYRSSLEALPEDFTYQLWAVVNDQVISAGILGPSPNVVPFHVDPRGLQGLVITREVAGGVEKSQAEPVVAWFDA